MRLRITRALLTALLAIASIASIGAGCSEATLNTPAVDPGPGPAGEDGSAPGPGDDGGPGNDDGATKPDGPPPKNMSNLRVMAANISTGTTQSYDPGEGIRIFQGLKPDVALIQEMKYGGNTAGDVTTFVTTAFGATYNYFREPYTTNGDLPNGIVSRYPIAMSGVWDDPKANNRSFVYAKITVPGSHPLWAISVHLLTSGAVDRNAEAVALTTAIQGVVAPGDYVVIGGDFNTDNRTETCLTTFQAIVDTKVVPADQAGNDFTSGPRSRPYDWVISSPTLTALQVPTVIGTNAFPKGLVFDSRAYMPLADVAPVKMSDCEAASGMQHMAVVKDFNVPL